MASLMVETPLTRETAITLAIYVYYIYGQNERSFVAAHVFFVSAESVGSAIHSATAAIKCMFAEMT